jgi:hypothetical protein
MTLDIKTRIVNAKIAIKVAQDALKANRAGLKQLIAEAKTDRSLTKTVREDQKKLRAAKAAERKAANIAKLEARLLALKSQKGLKKAARKSSAVKILVANGVKVAA